MLTDVVFIEVAQVQLEEAIWPETVHFVASHTTVWSTSQPTWSCRKNSGPKLIPCSVSLLTNVSATVTPQFFKGFLAKSINTEA